jgi:hypothetical protein
MDCLTYQNCSGGRKEKKRKEKKKKEAEPKQSYKEYMYCLNTRKTVLKECKTETYVDLQSYCTKDLPSTMIFST